MHAAEISVEIQRSFVLLSFPWDFLPVCIHLKNNRSPRPDAWQFSHGVNLDNSITYVNETVARVAGRKCIKRTSAGVEGEEREGQQVRLVLKLTGVLTGPETVRQSVLNTTAVALSYCVVPTVVKCLKRQE